MTTFYRYIGLRALFLILCLFVWLAPARARAEKLSDSTDIFDVFPQTASIASRTSKPLSHTAENITVITVADIEAMNAHSLADILDTIPGVQLQHNGGPGIQPFVFIQSANFIHVQVLIDGVSITNLNSGYSDVSSIPAYIIDRIEIIKGPSSTAWSQALGGVINVITKSPDKRLIGGTVSASIGQRTTADTHAEASGTSGKLGYYMSGGYFGTNGLLTGHQSHANKLYSKLTYDLSSRAHLWGTFGYSKADFGGRYVPEDWIDLKQEKLHVSRVASLGFRYDFGGNLELELTGRHFSYADWDVYSHVSTNPWLPDVDGLDRMTAKDSITGAGAKLTWRSNHHLLVVGSDYNHSESYSTSADYGWTYSPYRINTDRWNIFLNDAVTFGPICISPGVRFDHNQTIADEFGATLGITWQLTDSTILRAYTGKGYGLPIMNIERASAIKVWNSQIGFESMAVPYLWVKGTLFRNETWDNRDALNIDYTVPERRVAHGAELEARTAPLFNTSLGGGYTYTNTTRTGDNSQVSPDTARQTVQLSLRYDDKTFRGMLNGRHIFWNSPPEYNAKNNGLIWDLHFGATLLKTQDTSLELFGSGRNLFNSPYYDRDIFPDPGRWFEGGIRVKF